MRLSEMRERGRGGWETEAETGGDRARARSLELATAREGGREGGREREREGGREGEMHYSYLFCIALFCMILLKQDVCVYYVCVCVFVCVCMILYDFIDSRCMSCIYRRVFN